MSTQSLNISIIVPVYKVEQYLSKCIDSILSQTYPNWELLLIDDGSPDNSGHICDEYAKKDERIRVLHKENAGVSRARNLGLDNANGDYIMFVDSDDWLSNNCLEVCVNEINVGHLDALQFGLIPVSSGMETLPVKVTTKILDGEQYIQTNNFNVCVGGGVYKRDIIEKENMRFPILLKLAEDQIFILNFFRNTKRIKYLDRGMYYYLQRNNSAVHTAQSEDMLISCEALIHFSHEWPIAKSYIDSMIILFIVDMIKNDDVPYNQLKKIYKEQRVSQVDSKSKLIYLFPKLARINFYIACCVVALYIRMIIK